MSKIIPALQFVVISNTAKAVSKIQSKVDKLNAQIDELEALKAERDSLEASIKNLEVGCMALTGGYTSSQLLRKVVEKPAEGEEGKRSKTVFVPVEDVLQENADGSYTILDCIETEPEIATADATHNEE